jgi:hypothetical protein
MDGCRLSDLIPGEVKRDFANRARFQVLLFDAHGTVPLSPFPGSGNGEGEQTFE